MTETFTIVSCLDCYTQFGDCAELAKILCKDATGSVAVVRGLCPSCWENWKDSPDLWRAFPEMLCLGKFAVPIGNH